MKTVQAARSLFVHNSVHFLFFLSFLPPSTYLNLNPCFIHKLSIFLLLFYFQTLLQLPLSLQLLHPSPLQLLNPFSLPELLSFLVYQLHLLFFQTFKLQLQVFYLFFGLRVSQEVEEGFLLFSLLEVHVHVVFVGSFF